MAKMTLEDLRKLREVSKKTLERRDVSENDVAIIIGMGTCGIAAGAKRSLEAFLDEIDKKGLKQITVKQTGCMGLCYVEPTVEVKVPGMPDTIYGKVDEAVARTIVNEHIVQKKLVNNYIFDKPSVDIVKG
ncbi:MAG: (2Fe-2S) ferredoxin domain-containing protein [Spirochaetia bacterium]|jgi:NADP-reducing hydrogenase subunit HndB|nr:(2Fe-2S) ferredoxin domain-containing protein [Spirochaetia bacterium]